MTKLLKRALKQIKNITRNKRNYISARAYNEQKYMENQ